MKKFVISLDRTPERLNEFLKSNSTLDLFKFKAIDGLSISREQLLHDGIIDLSLKYSNGAIGCALSHITLWRHCVAINEPITIIEDDCILHTDFHNTSEQLSSSVNDYDLIQWGWNFEAPIIYLHSSELGNLSVSYDHDHLLQNIESFKTHNCVSTLSKVIRFFGSTCYSITPLGATKLINLLLPLKDVYEYNNFFFTTNPGIDATLNYVHPIMNSFACIPPIAFTTNDKKKTTIQSN